MTLAYLYVCILKNIHSSNKYYKHEKGIIFSYFTSHNSIAS